MFGYFSADIQVDPETAQQVDFGALATAVRNGKIVAFYSPTNLRWWIYARKEFSASPSEAGPNPYLLQTSGAPIWDATTNADGNPNTIGQGRNDPLEDSMQRDFFSEIIPAGSSSWIQNHLYQWVQAVVAAAAVYVGVELAVTDVGAGEAGAAAFETDFGTSVAAAGVSEDAAAGAIAASFETDFGASITAAGVDEATAAAAIAPVAETGVAASVVDGAALGATAPADGGIIGSIVSGLDTATGVVETAGQVVGTVGAISHIGNPNTGHNTGFIPPNQPVTPPTIPNGTVGAQSSSNSAPLTLGAFALLFLLGR